MAVHDRAILLAENSALREANKRRTRQRKQRRTTIASGGTLTISEGQDRVHESELADQIEVEVREADLREDRIRPRKRAAPRCSLCESLTHNARTCPRR